MKPILFAAIALLLYTGQVAGQSQSVQYSTEITEPDEMGWNKLLQLSNGNTFYFHWIKREGIGVTIYNKERKKTADFVMQGNEWNAKEMKTIKICALFEAGGKPVIFLQQLIDRTPMLYRVILDPQTGEIEGDKLVSKLLRYQAGYIFATSWGGVNPPAFHVEKDPGSNNYAIINFNSFARESEERIEAIMYGVVNGKHTELARSFYEAHGFKYLRFVSMAFDDKQRLCVAAYGFNTENSGGSDSRLIISRIATGETKFTNKLLEFSDDFKDTKGIMQYNPGSGMIQLMSLTYLTAKKNMFTGKTSTTYAMLMSYIDPETLTIVSVKPFMGEATSNYIITKLKDDEPYFGLPQGMVINSDNSTTILHEGIFKLLAAKSFSSEMLTLKTTIGNTGITVLDEKGVEKFGYAINKRQIAIGNIGNFAITMNNKGFWTYNEANSRITAPFFSFDYVNTPAGNYIIYNDFDENFDRNQSKKQKVADKVKYMNAVCYKEQHGDLTKSYLLGTPKDDDDIKPIYIQAGHYFKDNNTYATIVVENKISRVAWIKF